MKKCKVIMKRMSLASPDTNETHNYVAELAENENALALRYQDENHTHFMVVLNKGTLKLRCEGETKSELVLVPNEFTDVELTTPFGMMKLKSRALEIVKGKTYLRVRYELWEDQLVDEISLRWDIFRDTIS